MFILSVISVVVYKWLPVPLTPLMVSRFFETGKLKKEWVPMEKISPNMQLAVVSSEDQNFLKHWGFDLEGIQKALEEKEEKGRVRGASTISQQTAKNVFLYNGQNYVRKGLEAYFTVLIELIWGKERILEVYLNVAEFGKGIYGVQAASQYYFKKDAKNLTKAEAAMLAGILPNPNKIKIKGNYIQNKRKYQIIRQMRNLGGKISFE